MLLDSHQHFWQYTPAQYPWIKPDWSIRRDCLPAELEPLLAQSDFEGSIAVQARQSLEETGWLLDLADRHPFIKGVVGWIDLRCERVEEQLGQFAGRTKFVGVRHVIQDEADDQFMLRPEFLRGISKLAQFNLTYDLLIFPRQLPAAIALTRQFPEQRFVLDHIAKPQIKVGARSPWSEQMVELAKLPNVTCKISGLVTEASWGTWRKADFQPYLDIVFDAFGFHRLMFGSDWPVCLLSASYRDVVGIVRDRLAGMPEAAQKAIMGGNATKFYLDR
jgi:L-fuconolactonase